MMILVEERPRTSGLITGTPCRRTGRSPASYAASVSQRPTTDRVTGDDRVTADARVAGPSDTGSGSATAGPRDFDRDAAERVLRRAVELAEDNDPTGGADHGISEQALIEAAEELGVDVAVVRRAAVEERMGLLVQAHRFGDALVGPGALTVHRVVPGEPAEVLDRLDVWLRKLSSLRRQRRDAVSASYARRSDVAARLQHTARSISGSEDIRRVRRLSAVCTPVDTGSTMVVLRADLQLERHVAVASGAGVAGLGSTVAVAEALTFSPWLWLGVPASIAAGTGVLIARSHGVPDVEASLQGVVDKVSSGEVPGSVLGGVTDRVMRNMGRSRRIT